MANHGETLPKNQLFIVKLPEKTSDWNESADEIFKLFKVRTCLFDVDTVLWPSNTDGVNLSTFFERHGGKPKPYYEIYFDYLDKVLAELDTNDDSWYAAETQYLGNNAEGMFAVILKTMREYHVKPTSTFFGEMAVMKDRITEFLCMLRMLLEMDLSLIPKFTFTELFRKFIGIVGLYCYQGNYLGKMKFGYYNTQGTCIHSVSSEPELLVGSREGIVQGYAVAVVEVKKPSKDTKVEQMSLSASSMEDDNSIASLLKLDYPNGNPRLLTEEERKVCSAFLPQLFGEVIAALNVSNVKLRHLPHLEENMELIVPLSERNNHVVPVHRKSQHTALQSVIGLGVIGLQVYVVNFLCVRRDAVLRKFRSMHHIPFTDGLGTDILIAEPLHLLKRQDRKKLFQILTALRIQSAMETIV